MNARNEWKFIQEQFHEEPPSKKNAMKREVLFCLQLLLSNMKEKETVIYNMTKEFYLNL